MRLTLQFAGAKLCRYCLSENAETRHGKVTSPFGARDTEHDNAVALADYLAAR
jgi:hypothetical protein